LTSLGPVSKFLHLCLFLLPSTLWLLFQINRGLHAAGHFNHKGGSYAKGVERVTDGSKVWEGGGTIDLKGPVTLKVKNTLAAEHGFAIDSMKVMEVIKPGEEKTITVPREKIDKSVSEHKVYCQLHPKHVPATIKVMGK
jgi:hypothetical protein